MYDISWIYNKARVVEILLQTASHKVYKVSPKSIHHKIGQFLKGVWGQRHRLYSFFVNCIYKMWHLYSSLNVVLSRKCNGDGRKSVFSCPLQDECWHQVWTASSVYVFVSKCVLMWVLAAWGTWWGPDISKYYFHLAFRCSFYYNPRAMAPLRIVQQSQVGCCDKDCCNQNQAATQFLSHRADGVYITGGWPSAVPRFLCDCINF